MYFLTAALLVSCTFALDLEKEDSNVIRAKRQVPWMVDEAYNVRNEEWYKYDCKECFKPYEINMRDFHLLDGWHKELKCRTSSPEDYVRDFKITKLLWINAQYMVLSKSPQAVLSANDRRDVVSVGRGVASKVIRCNDNGKWVTDLGDDEIEIEDAFCLVIPGDD
ncbi:hypothetical protein OSTOST_01809, partial [Ostertagia ostertagi]